jgi:hypothetical protein
VPLSVVVPALFTACCLVDTIKAELHLTPAKLGVDGDDILAGMVEDASAAVQRYCGYPFAAASYHELLPGNDSPQLMLARTPLIAITEVLFQSDPLLDVVIADADAGLVYRERGFGWTGTFVWGVLSDTRAMGSERPIYSLKYRAGFRMPEDDAPEDVLHPRPSDGAQALPRDIQRATIETVKAYWEGRSGVLVKSKSVADLSLSYNEIMPGELPAGVKSLLIPWRRAV